MTDEYNFVFVHYDDEKPYFSLTEREAKYLFGELDMLLNAQDAKLEKLIGHSGVLELRHVHHKLQMHDFCLQNGVKYEDLTEEDYERYYRQKYEA